MTWTAPVETVANAAFAGAGADPLIDGPAGAGGGKSSLGSGEGLPRRRTGRLLSSSADGAGSVAAGGAGGGAAGATAGAEAAGGVVPAGGAAAGGFG